MSGCFTCTRADNTLSSITTVYWEILNALLSPDININHLNRANKVLHLCEECMKLLKSINEFRTMAAKRVLLQAQYWNMNEDIKPCSIVEMNEIDIKQERLSPVPDGPYIKQEKIPVEVLLTTNGPECITCQCDVKTENQDCDSDTKTMDEYSEAMEPDPLCEDKPKKPKKKGKKKGLEHAKTGSRTMNRRERPYTVAVLEEALKKINAKDLTLTEAGKKYGIPKTTLHYQLHGKTPLMLERNVIKKEMEPLKKKRKARRKERLYPQGKLEEAVAKIRKDEITLTQASKTYDIPKTTLASKVHGITPLVCKKGPDRILSNDEERYIATWIADKIKSDGRVGVNEVKEAVARLFEERGLPRMKPGMKWYRLFRQRHRSYFLKQSRTLEEIAKEGLERSKNEHGNT